jgi:hypothetical protein
VLHHLLTDDVQLEEATFMEAAITNPNLQAVFDQANRSASRAVIGQDLSADLSGRCRKVPDDLMGRS